MRSQGLQSDKYTEGHTWVRIILPTTTDDYCSPRTMILVEQGTRKGFGSTTQVLQSGEPSLWSMLTRMKILEYSSQEMLFQNPKLTISTSDSTLLKLPEVSGLR